MDYDVKTCPECGWPLAQVGLPARVLDKDAFGYVEPRQGQAFDHNQAETCNCCIHFTGVTCEIHGRNVRVFNTSSCVFQIPGKPKARFGEEYPFVTIEESGLIHTRAQCRDCISFDPVTNICRFFEVLNRTLPGICQINIFVDEFGGCNCFRPLDGKDSNKEEK